jgi:UPF0716 family protein affecting phage T7 exclusion
MAMNGSEQPRMMIFPRLRPLTLLLFFVSWIIFEWFLFKALSNQFGFFASMVFYVAKGGLGLLLLGLTMRRIGTGLPQALRQGKAGEAASTLLFSVLGAVLIALPGLIPALFGIAVFSPSVRKKITSLMFRQTGKGTRQQEESTDIELDQSQWRSDRK